MESWQRKWALMMIYSSFQITFHQRLEIKTLTKTTRSINRTDKILMIPKGKTFLRMKKKIKKFYKIRKKKKRKRKYNK